MLVRNRALFPGSCLRTPGSLEFVPGCLYYPGATSSTWVYPRNIMGRVLLFPFLLLLSFLSCSVSHTASDRLDASVRNSGNERPNILIAISDDQSYPYASAYGSTSTQTPHFDRIAKDGVLFTNAFVASPGCSPSRAALLTGMYPWELEHAGTHASYFSKDFVVFPDLLEEAGYAVGFTGKGWGPGSWQKSGRERNPAGPEYNEYSTPNSPQGINAKDYSANFNAFLDKREADQPFYFWYGAHEPHRVFKDGIGTESGKKLYDAEVPKFLPDAPEIRSDILDYAYEIEHFDHHLGRILTLLEEKGELENTIVIVTSDNGMAFPRAKANAFEYGIHVPLAISWPAHTKGHRTSNDLISLVDLAPTILEATNVSHPSPDVLSGKSLLNILESEDSGIIDAERRAVFSARERHSSSRFNSLSYPQRAIRTHNFLYIKNFKPERWPAGAPQKFAADGSLEDMHNGYHDIDAAPSLTYLIENRDAPTVSRYFHLSVDLRPEEELYDIRKDPACLNNLATAPGYQTIKHELNQALIDYLSSSQDPRVMGNGDIFETYPRVSRLRWFPEPAWVQHADTVFRPTWLDKEDR